MEFTIKLRKYRDPAKGNWTTDLTGGYENIRGKVYDFFKYAEGDRVLDKNNVEVEPPQYTSSGYWGAKGELTGLIKGFKNPVSQAEVNIEKIEDTLEATQEWDKMTPGDQYYLYVAFSVAQSLESKYKKEFGIEIKLDVIKVPVKPKDPAPKDPPKEISSIPGKADATAKYVSAQNSADGTPTKITYDMIKDGAAIARIEASPIFKYDKDRKKITIVAKDVFYEADALDGQLWTWNMKYGKSEFVSMDSVLTLEGYPPEQAPTTPAQPAEDAEGKPKSYGEMPFDVREENVFYNQKFGKLSIIGLGKIPKEKLEVPKEEEEDDEYVEEQFENDVELEEMAITIDFKSTIDPNLGSPTTESLSRVEDNNVNYDPSKFVGGKWKAFDYNIVDKLPNKFKPNAIFKDSLKKVLYYMKNDPTIDDPRKAAYLLATAFGEAQYSLQRWESDYSCNSTGIAYGAGGPCKAATDYYKQEGIWKKGKDGKKVKVGNKVNYYTLGTDSKGLPYFGRGLIQLTGKSVYKKYGDKIGVDLVNNADLAFDPQNSYKIASIWMGPDGTNTFSYLLDPNKKRCSKKSCWTGLEAARRSVNGGVNGLADINAAYKAWLDVLGSVPA